MLGDVEVDGSERTDGRRAGVDSRDVAQTGVGFGHRFRDLVPLPGDIKPAKRVSWITKTARIR